jgi:hypothetical protein
MIPLMTSILAERPLHVAMFCNLTTGNPALELAQGIAAEGAEVDLFSLGGEGEPEFETNEGVRVHRAIPIGLPRPVQVRMVPGLPQLAYSCLRRNPPDVIHAYGTSFSALVAAGVARVLRKPLVTTLSGEEPGPDPLPKRLPAFAYNVSLGRAVLRASDRIISGFAYPVRETLELYVDALAERELRWFLKEQSF